MEKVQLNDDLSLSRIIYGMWRLKEDTDTSASHVQAKIEACLAQGITSFDQADIYGDYGSEGVLGEALKVSPSLRDQMEIITKCDIVAPIGIHADKPLKYYDTTPAYIRASVDRSLSEMAIEQIDLLLLHRPDPLMNATETGAALDALVESGKVKAIGVSNFRPWDWSLLQTNMSSILVTNQIEISVLETSSFTNGDLAFLQEHHIAPMAWSPLGGGRLFGGENPKLEQALDTIASAQGVDRSAVAIAWLLAHPAKIIPVMGTNNLERIQSFDTALKVEIDRPTWFSIYEAANGQEVA